MNKKGFTLIELLAVIVILAIIALIATPIITGIVANVKKGGAESSALGWIDAVEKQVMLNMLDDNKLSDGTYNVSELDVKVKGETPKAGWIEIEKGQVKDYELGIGEYVVTPKDGNPSKAIAVKGTVENTTYVYSRVTGATHVGFPIDANIVVNNKYVFHYTDDYNVPYNTLEECKHDHREEECILENFTTPNLDYKDSPSPSWGVYLKHKINDKGIIKDTEVCGNYNGTEFCLQHSANGSKYESNKIILANVYGNDKCEITTFAYDDPTESFECKGSPNYDSINAESTILGKVDVWDYAHQQCRKEGSSTRCSTPFCRISENGSITCYNIK